MLSVPDVSCDAGRDWLIAHSLITRVRGGSAGSALGTISTVSSHFSLISMTPTVRPIDT